MNKNELINNLKNIDYSGLPNRKCYYKTEYYSLADEQADYVVAVLNTEIPEYDWEVVPSNDTLLNLTEGDLVAKQNGRTIYKIDIKVAAPNGKGYIGTIDLNSVIHFADNDNAIYICFDEYGEPNLFEGTDVYNLLNTTKCLCETLHANRWEETNELLRKYNSCFSYKKQPGVSPYDFIGTKQLLTIKK